MNESVNALISVMSILFILIFLFWFYQDYKLDSFRQKMFMLRDQLFNYAAEGHISFDDESYLLLRNTMNGAIRYAHKLNLVEVSISAALCSRSEKDDNNFFKALDCSIKHLSPEQQKHMQKVAVDMNLLLMGYMVEKSPVLVSIGFTIVFFVVAKFQIDALLSLFKAPIKRADNIAMKEGAIISAH